jgi:addiction module RelE/StbE family toxin
VKLAWSVLALQDFEDATDYIAADNPIAAQQIAERINEATQKLTEYPYIGHPGDDENTREWLIRQTPYVLVYEIHGDTVYISRVWHTRRGRSSDPEPAA